MKHLSTTKWGASILHVNNKELSIIKQGLELLQQQSGLLEPIQMLEALEAINIKEKESPKLTPEEQAEEQAEDAYYTSLCNYEPQY